MLSADGQRLVGNLNIRAYLKNTTDSGRVSVFLQFVATDCKTDMGYETGTYLEMIATGGSTLTGNSAIVDDSTIAAGAPKKFQGNYLIVIRKISGKWLIVEHASVPQQTAPLTR